MLQWKRCIWIYVALLSCLGVLRLRNAIPLPFSKKITVATQGGGDFRAIQEAIDQGVPEYNRQWVYIYLYTCIYIGSDLCNTVLFSLVTCRENVLIHKPYIYMEGQTGVRIASSYSNNIASATFTVAAENFVARNIIFQNTYNRELPIAKNPRSPAVAAIVKGEKTPFYGCGFLRVQDTLWDASGRHLFRNCYIEVDFIVGNGQSVYEVSKLIFRHYLSSNVHTHK
ncbi:hypothetical protein GIB67_023573 [Kingdonia uniflora]|uniref:pectinesterase n=1 Tax=Kingdonia uniflora TaxID=39325 RepID=A0A7J7PAI1_9MAGN|nr:hypothetical protein GIB67_023573 [Kingdonia uniflora]